MYELDDILRHVSSIAHMIRIWEFRAKYFRSYTKFYVSGDLILPKFVKKVCQFQQYLEYSVNIDITSYDNGERFTHNPEGQAVPQVVWDYFQVICRHRGT